MTSVTGAGADGGPDYERALELAGKGYEVYALFFFGQDNQRSELERVPVEFFSEVTERIEAGAVSPGPVTVIGTSKGAEVHVFPHAGTTVSRCPRRSVLRGRRQRSGRR